LRRYRRSLADGAEALDFLYRRRHLPVHLRHSPTPRQVDQQIIDATEEIAYHLLMAAARSRRL
jgi:hypothetical protein